jgi:hypothetical protein
MDMNEVKAAALLAQARHDELMQWKIDVLDESKYARIAPATNALRELLREIAPKAVSQNVAMATLVESSDLTLKTCASVLSQLVKAGAVEKSGAYVRGTRKRRAQDTRTYRLADW